MPKPYRIKQGDCIASIAFAEKLPAERIWMDDANRALRQRCGDPHTLLPDLDLTIPDKRPATFDAKSTGHTHTFRLKDQSLTYRIDVLLCGEPLDGASVEVAIDGKAVVVSTNAATSTCRIPPDAKKAVIRILDRDPAADDDAAQFEVNLGMLDPLREASGQRQRLANTGYLSATVTDLNDALRLFQPLHGIAPPDATPDNRTKIPAPILDAAASVPALKTLTGDIAP